MFVSKYVFNQDLKKVKEILDRYRIRTQFRPYYGLKIKGEEADIRQCISSEGLTYDFISGNELTVFRRKIDDVSEIVSKSMNETNYRMSDIAFQNLIAHVVIAVERIKLGKLEKGVNNKQLKKLHEYKLATHIFESLKEKYGIPLGIGEIEALTLNLQGKRNLEDQQNIPDLYNQMVVELLKRIKKELGVDLIYDVELRTSLVLHLVPLINRIHYNHQTNSGLLATIQRKYPLAHEMAIIAKDYIEEYLGVEKHTVIEDEINYLTIHFGLALENMGNSKKAENILIVCNSRRSEALLIVQTIKNWFPGQFRQVDVINRMDYQESLLDNYDLVLSTGEVSDHDKIVHIHSFLTPRDKVNIEMKLKGFKDNTEVLKYFNEGLFFCGKEIQGLDRKENVLKYLCDKVTDQFVTTENLYESVMRREEMGYTCFDNHIVLTHPSDFCTYETVVAACVLNKGIEWDGKTARIVILVCPKPGAVVEIRSFYELMRNFMNNKTMIDKAMECNNFSEFLQCFNYVNANNYLSNIESEPVHSKMLE